MMRLALFEDLLDGPLALPPAVRGLYARRGAVTLDGAPLAEDSATLATDAITLGGAGGVWGFEISVVPALVGPAEWAGLILAHPLPREPALPFVFRLDRVDFPPVAETPQHGHAGLGIRRLLAGRLPRHGAGRRAARPAEFSCLECDGGGQAARRQYRLFFDTLTTLDAP